MKNLFRIRRRPAAVATVTLIEKKSGPWMPAEVQKFLACGGKIWRSGGDKIAAVKLPEAHFLYRALEQADNTSFTTKVVPIKGAEMKALSFV